MSSQHKYILTGVISGLHDQKMLRRVICLETRPYNQGSRLTATELSHQVRFTWRLGCYPYRIAAGKVNKIWTQFTYKLFKGIDFRLICDSMAAYSITEFQVDAIIVGADRVVANGDTANKVITSYSSDMCPSWAKFSLDPSFALVSSFFSGVVLRTVNCDQ